MISVTLVAWPSALRSMRGFTSSMRSRSRRASISLAASSSRVLSSTAGLRAAASRFRLQTVDPFVHRRKLQAGDVHQQVGQLVERAKLVDPRELLVQPLLHLRVGVLRIGLVGGGRLLLGFRLAGQFLLVLH